MIESVYKLGLNRLITYLGRAFKNEFKMYGPMEKKRIAYHEAGHVVCAWCLDWDVEYSSIKVKTNDKRLGYTAYSRRHQYVDTNEDLLNIMCIKLSGRAAEEIFFGCVGTGCSEDVKRATQDAYTQIAQYGMNANIGPIYYDLPQYGIKPYSERTAQLIDSEANALLNKAYVKSITLVKQNKSDVEKIGLTLMEKEFLNRDDIIDLLSKRPVKEPKTSIEKPDNKLSNLPELKQWVSH